jgi:ribosomal protein S18 acetylase RimI-like enzyme
VLERIDAYCDAVPRAAAQVEEHGPLRLFVADGVPWPYYARPAGSAPVTVEDVRAVRARQWELGQPETFEWVVDLAPSLGPAASASGLEVLEVPLMALDEPLDVPAVDARVRPVAPDDEALAAAQAVAQIAFAAPGTARGEAGERARDAALAGWPEARLRAVRERMAAGRTITFVAEGTSDPVAGADEAGIGPGSGRGVLAVGSHQRVGAVTEIVGVATLPAARRRGLAAAVTAALVADARERGAEVIFLSAGSEDVARVYARLGFVRIGTAGLASPRVST